MNDSSVLEKIKHRSLSDQVLHVRMGIQIAHGLTTIGQRSEAEHMISEMIEILWNVAEELEADHGND
jgi:hypothetical protein